MYLLGSAVDTWATVAGDRNLGGGCLCVVPDLVVTPRRRPRLELRFGPGGNDRLLVEAEGGLDAAYVRLRVANREGKDTADDVVVMVTELRRLADSENAVDDARHIGLPLTWSGSNPPLTVSSVHPGSERHIDLLHVDQPARSEIVPLELDLTPRPAGGHDLVEAGTYEISVEVRARNADAIRYAVPVSWDGTWSGAAAIWDRLRVEPPRRVR